MIDLLFKPISDFTFLEFLFGIIIPFSLIFAFHLYLKGRKK